MGAIGCQDGITGACDVDLRNVNAVVAPAVKEFNEAKESARTHNRIRDAMKKGGARFLPPKKKVPTSYQKKIDNSSMDQ